jgi:arylsulfatase
MIARWPSHIKPEQTSDHISAFWDVLPTLCDIVGITPSQNIDGISFAPTLLGQSNQKQHEYLYWEFRAYGGQQVVRMGHWKGVRQNLAPKGKNKDKQPDLSIELYDLAADPGEKHDIADQYPKIVERIATIMTNARTPNPDFPIPALDGS